jgi:hypothetical protein
LYALYALYVLYVLYVLYAFYALYVLFAAGMAAQGFTEINPKEWKYTGASCMFCIFLCHIGFAVLFYSNV